ncbi:MAG: hypothetical protein NTY66_01570 [Candidatus Vogelbacteria bacterium]|nr:hypothetical protein [Candidatus Vogelbacteria bacterium]
MPIKKNQSRGFVILYAVIITTVVLVMGVSLMNIVTKQLVLSSISRGAKLSYFAAIAGKDCAEYWKAIDYFGRVDENGGVVAPSNQSIIGCPDNTQIGGFLLRQPATPVGATMLVTKFQLELVEPDTPHGGLCSLVTVTVDSSACPADWIMIESEGYNVPCGQLASDNPRRVKSVYSDNPNCYPPPTTP